MISYDKWSKDEIDVTNIELDIYNPRLPDNSGSLSQNELVNYLISNYSVYDEIAKSIVTRGYYPLKFVVLVKNKDTNKYTVIEGNRRIAALKALINPDIVTQPHRNKFVRLSEQIDKKVIKKIPVLIAPSREAVVPLLFAEHALNPTRKWSPLMKAEFYANELKSDKTIEELSKECDLSTSDIKNALKLLNMYKIACTLDLPDEILSKVHDKEGFPASTLERIYESKLFQENLKFEFDEEGNIVGKCEKSEFLTSYKKVINDIVKGPQQGGIDSRSINTDVQKKEYIRTFYDKLPQKTGSFTTKDLLSNNTSTSQTMPIAKPVEPKTRRSNRLPKGLITSGVVFQLETASCIKKVYDALKTISVNKYPVPSAVLLRVLLDKTLRYKLNEKRIKTLTISENGVDVQKKIDDVTLKQILEFLTSKTNPLSIENGILKNIKKFHNSNSHSSLSALNNIIHNPDFTLDEEEVRDTWNNLEGLFKTMLTKD